MPVSRQLAAIMFTDIAGYTALMGEDEQKAFDVLRTNRQLQKPLIEKFNGSWIKELGDGVLASFPTATDAVLCASEIQKACAEIHNLKLRIGIHVGDVVFEDGDVFGDGVNIASRLQALAPVGGTWISEAVHKNVSNKKEIETRYVGEEILKHVKEPVKIYELIPNYRAVEQDQPTSERGKKLTEKSIAVLPFINMSSDPEQEYFSDGIAEEIINSLAHLQDLKVAGRTSSFQFRQQNLDLKEIGRKLGVNTVLEGSIRKQGNRLRITLQLINVHDGFHLWSEKYDRELDDIFAIQDEIALAITEKLKVTLLDNDRELIKKIHTLNSEAYELYLKGRFYVNRRGNFVLTGMKYFKEAMEKDPQFSLAYSGYADALNIAAFYGFFSGRSVMEEILQASKKAIELDSSQCEARCSLASYYALFEWNWPAAKENFLAGIKLNQNYAQGHSWYSMAFLAWIEGKFEEAEKEAKVAIKREPLSSIAHANLAWTFYTARRFEHALDVAKTGIELDSNSFLSHRLVGLSYIGLRRYDEAVQTFKNLSNISNRHQHSLTGLVWAYCSDGNFEEARKIMKELKERAETEYIAPGYFGIAAAYLGDLDSAFELLHKAYDDHDPNITQLKYSPFVPDKLRDDPRFQDILLKIGFPP